MPCLKRNWFVPPNLAIQKTRPMAYRAKVLGRALAVRTGKHVLMLISGNAEVAFRSRTLTIVWLPLLHHK
jgi:hypothetical protein